MTKQLTIAIPCYNRPKKLDKILNVLLEEDTSTFSILISDDSTDNGVKELVGNYIVNHENITYKKNIVNLGFSKNVSELYKLTQTKYVWFLCDDDSVFPGCVSSIIDEINKYKPSVAIFNCTWNDSYGLKRQAYTKDTYFHTDADNESIYSTMMRMSFLSLLVFEKDSEVLNRIKEFNYIDNVFVQITLGLQILSLNFRLLESSKIILHRNVGYKYGNFSKFILLDPLKSIYLVPHKFENKKFRRFFIEELWNFYRLYLSQKIGLYDYQQPITRDSIVLIIKYYGLYSIPIFISWIISLIIPKFLVRGLYFVKILSLYGAKDSHAMYRKLVNRAYLDTRETGFITYK